MTNQSAILVSYNALQGKKIRPLDDGRKPAGKSGIKQVKRKKMLAQQ